MSRSRKRLRRVLGPSVLGLLFLLIDAPGRPIAERGAPLSVAGAPAPASIPRLAELDPAYTRAAKALGQGQCAAALGELAPLTADDHPEAPFARVVQGLHAHACGELEVAEERLFLGGGRGTALEDWRLLMLAESASKLGDHPVARAAIDKMLAETSTHPLYPLTLEAAAEIAWRAGDGQRVFEIIERAQPHLGDEALARLDGLAWEVAAATGDEAAKRRVARRLVVRSPRKAEELAVVDLFRSTDGTVDWAAFLTPTELEDRARSLLASRQLEEALATLEAVAEEDRDNAWHLLAASVLIRSRQGAEAQSLLAGVVPTTLEEAANLEWERARATRDLATARRGRHNLPSADRHRMRRRSWDHLQRVLELDGDGALARRALQILFEDLASEDRFDEAMEVLKTLRRLDTTDSTGSDHLWRRGWNAFVRRNFSSAIGYWAELASLYPEVAATRSGRYWTARAYEALGDPRRASEIYREVAAVDTTDFYRKYALIRLGGDAEPDPAAGRTPGQSPEPWPQDPHLDRAMLLSDLTLDELALTELDSVLRSAGSLVDPRAAEASRALILARRGDPRASIAAIRRAFPALGGPRQAGVPFEALRLYYPLGFEETVRLQADRHGLPLHVLLAMIRQESGFDPNARSHAGAQGLLQLMPATGREVARRIGIRFSNTRLTDPAFNLHLGAAYFQQVLGMFGGDLDLALAGYNGGPYRIRRLWRQWGRNEVDTFLEGLRLTESRTYVKRIQLLSDSYLQIYDLAEPDRIATSGLGGSTPGGLPAR